jgi:hypothetical protein
MHASISRWLSPTHLCPFLLFIFFWTESSSLYIFSNICSFYLICFVFFIYCFSFGMFLLSHSLYLLFLFCIFLFCVISFSTFFIVFSLLFNLKSIFCVISCIFFILFSCKRDCNCDLLILSRRVSEKFQLYAIFWLQVRLQLWFSSFKWHTKEIFQLQVRLRLRYSICNYDFLVFKRACKWGIPVTSGVATEIF